MSGDSSSKQTQTSQTDPYAPAIPAVNGILGQVQSGLSNTGLTGAETGALNSIEANAAQPNPYATQIGANATNLLNGGGAMNQAGAVNQNYQNYFNQMNPMASNTNYDPTQSPGMQAVLQQIQGDVGSQVNGMFAGAGRDLSGMNQQTWARGIAQGEAQPLLAQYNQNIQNQQGAAGNLYNAGNTNAGILSGMQQQALANTQVGTQAATDAWNSQNQGANATLQAEAQRRGIPVQALGMLAQIGIPIAGLGGTSSGTTTGTQQMSGAQQFGLIANGVGSLASSLFGGGGAGGTGALANASKFISDRRAKEDITQVGTLFDGTPVYRYRYIGQPAFQIGLMAQDVEKYAPEAVGQIGEFKAVDYKLATDKAVEAA